ncbi:ATP-binding cassette domain-containing protein [Microbacterium amylolyticum]|uniref:UvrABC system protein A n=1 Tax=Microbacterium amylolyticum TaxID=936337 RepID=A0ABS4ZF55_9MICO|nr:excinuclease ABC subunit UvrA [Microbacterium amylolyticum]MBP2435615.1 excinuclease UvrABC ATPase subunit [Microbacterium amylolyticum]
MNPGVIHPADTHDVIRVRGARENNLRGVDVDLPKRRITVFTGVSGSGKSSLAFETIANESQRMINETYSAFLQGFMPSSSRPDVDLLEGLTTAIVVSQDRLAANIRSTVGTASDAGAMLRTLFSRIGEPQIGPPNAFSFNTPSVTAKGAIEVQRGQNTTRERAEYSVLGGMCAGCEGTGRVSDLDLTQLYDASLSINDGAILVPGYKVGGWTVRFYAESGFFDADKPVGEFTDDELNDFLYKESAKVKIGGTNMTYMGLVPQIRKSMLSKDREAMQSHIRAFVDRAVTFQPCPACEGTRLAEPARRARVAGVNIAQCCSMQITDLLEWVHSVDDPGVAPLTGALEDLLRSFVDIGLGYLSLDRASGTLSGGEAQRLKMIKHLGSPLTDVTYVFDEPTAGLHPHDVPNMNDLLRQLRDKGNTVLVVEHKPETIAIADHIVDVGPGAGRAGGDICFTGTVEELRSSGTVTGRHLGDRARVKDLVRRPTGAIEIRGAASNNLRGVNVDVPTGVLVALTGVAGSGKSSLVAEGLANRKGVVFVDQSPIKGSIRSNPATYTGLLEPIRKAFAKKHGVKPALFSANSEGACPTCKGNGQVTTDLGFMQGVTTPCEDCGGRRFLADVLQYTLGERSIADVLELSISDAQEFFASAEARVPPAGKILARLVDVGLGYISLGQTLTTLSGGERQRLKLAAQMAEGADVYVLDEPTTGLHLADVENMLSMLDRLVDSGATVVAIEHHQAVMAHADWIIDMGPGAGQSGGRVVFEGRPADLVAARSTLTGEHLAEYAV